MRDRTAGFKVMARKLFRPKFKLLAIAFEPVVRLMPNFECEKLGLVDGLFAQKSNEISGLKFGGGSFKNSHSSWYQNLPG